MFPPLEHAEMTAVAPSPLPTQPIQAHRQVDTLVLERSVERAERGGRGLAR